MRAHILTVVVKQREEIEADGALRLPSLLTGPGDVLPAAKLPELNLPQTTPPTGEPSVQMPRLWGTFLIQTNHHSQ